MSDYVVTLNKSKFNVSIKNDKLVTLDENNYTIELINIRENNYLLKLNNCLYEIHYYKKSNEEFHILVNNAVYETEIRTLLQEKAMKLLESKKTNSGVVEVKAPMPGMILKIKKKVGNKIKEGESVMILEAMKMENELKSPGKGTIQNIFVEENKPVEKGTVLFTLVS